MAGDFQKQVFIGRLTRDPEIRVLNGGSKVAKFGFAFCGRRTKDPSGQWKEEPCFIEVQAFDNSTGSGRQTASIIEKYLFKGSKVFLETVMHLEQWTDNAGNKKQALKFTVRDLIFLDSKQDAEGRSSAPPRQSQQTSKSSGGGFYDGVDVDADGGSGGSGGFPDDVPF